MQIWDYLFSEIRIYKVFLIFSDGFTESLDKILEKFRAESKDGSKHVRIFSYAVGPHPLPVTALKEMACGTQGSHTMITSMGALRTSIQVINRRFVKKNLI